MSVCRKRVGGVLCVWMVCGCVCVRAYLQVGLRQRHVQADDDVSCHDAAHALAHHEHEVGDDEQTETEEQKVLASKAIRKGCQWIC